MYFVDIYAGFVMSTFAVIYITIAMFLYFKNRALVVNELVSFATQYGQIQKQLLRDFELPYALLDDAGKIISVANMYFKRDAIISNDEYQSGHIQPTAHGHPAGPKNRD